MRHLFFFKYISIQSPPFFLTWEGEGESNAFHVVLYPPPNDNPHSSDFYFLSFPMYANLYYPIHNFSMYIRVPVESRSYKNVSKEKGGGGHTLLYRVPRNFYGSFKPPARVFIRIYRCQHTFQSSISGIYFFFSLCPTSFPSLPGHPGHSFLSITFS